MQTITGPSNRILEINCTEKTWKVSSVEKNDLEDYLGGKGLGLKIFYDRFGKNLSNLDALGPENILCIMTGVLAGSGAPCSARFSGITKSPLTEIMVTSSCGGPFGIALRTAGYDGVLFSGRSEEPLLVEIFPDRVDFLSAAALAGKTTMETQESLGMKNKDGALAIGPAGENLVKYANIASGHRFFGRGGMGAVMGSKNLKAVVARGGEYKIEPVLPEMFKKVKKKANVYLKRNSFVESYKKYGTPANVNFGIEAGFLPVRNFRDRTHGDAHSLTGEEMAERFATKHSTCVPCSILCGHKGTYPDGKVRQIPEYETVGVLGPNIGNFDPVILAQWNERINELGMDTISLGVTLGWAMEAAEKGIRPSSLSFGDPKGIIDIIEDIAYRRGEGRDLADGTRCLSGKYGGTDYAIHVKGLELAAYDPRAGWGQGLNYAVANRGGCHLNAYPIGQEAIFKFLNPYTAKAKARWVDFFENLFSALNSLQTCQFTAFGYILEPPVAKYTPKPFLKIFMGHFPRMTMLLLDYSVLSRFFWAITGIKLPMNTFLAAGRRTHVLERYMNTLMGINIKDDTLPERFLKEGKTAHPVDSVVPIETLRRDYYRVKGYDFQGLPLEKTLIRLGIKPVSKSGQEAFQRDSGNGRIKQYPAGQDESDSRRRPGYGLPRVLKTGRKPFKTFYCRLLMWFVGRAIVRAYKIDGEIKKETDSLPYPFTLALRILPAGPGITLKKNPDGSLSKIPCTEKADLAFLIKNLEAAFLLFTFRESTCVSLARDRLISEGPLPEACTFVRILNRIEILLLPKFIASLAVKRYEKPSSLAGKRLRLYLKVLFS